MPLTAILVASLVFGCSLLTASRRLNLGTTQSEASTSSIIASAPGKSKKKKPASAKGESKSATKTDLEQSPSTLNERLVKLSDEMNEEMIIKELAAQFPNAKMNLTVNDPEEMVEKFRKRELNSEKDVSEPSPKGKPVSGMRSETSKEMDKHLEPTYPDLSMTSKTSKDVTKDMGGATSYQPDTNWGQQKAGLKFDALEGKDKGLQTLMDLAEMYPKLSSEWGITTQEPELKQKQKHALPQPRSKDNSIYGQCSKSMVHHLSGMSHMIDELAASLELTLLELTIWQSKFGLAKFERADQVAHALATPFVELVTKSCTEAVLVDAATTMTRKLLAKYLQMRGMPEAAITENVAQLFSEDEELTFALFAQRSLGKHDLFSRMFFEVLAA